MQDNEGIMLDIDYNPLGKWYHEDCDNCNHCQEVFDEDDFFYGVECLCYPECKFEERL